MLFKNNNNIIISIIIPTYNREKYIVNSVKSVLNQNFNNIEIIIVDDLSKDNTRYEIEKIKDNRIKYIKLNKNKGACYARNLGIKIAKGKFISFQDSDDLYRFDKLKKQMENLNKYNSDFDFCRICVHVNQTLKIYYPNDDIVNEIKNKNIFDILLSKGNFISTQSILVKKNYIEKFLFDTKFPRWQDYDLVLRIIPNVKVSFTNETLVDVYKQKDSISLFPEKLKKAIILLLNKNYGFNASQKEQFSKYLNEVKTKIIENNF